MTYIDSMLALRTMLPGIRAIARWNLSNDHAVDIARRTSKIYSLLRRFVRPRLLSIKDKHALSDGTVQKFCIGSRLLWTKTRFDKVLMDVSEILQSYPH